MKIFFRIILPIIGVIFVLFFLSTAGALAYLKNYQGKIYPGVYINDYPLGGLSGKEAVSLIENINNRFAKEGVDFIVVNPNNGQEDKVKFSALDLTANGGDDAVELIRLDSDRLARGALAVGRGNSWWGRLWQPVRLKFFSAARFSAPVSVNDDKKLILALTEHLSRFEDTPRDASIIFDDASADFKIIPEKAGQVFDYAGIAEKLKNNLAALSFAPIKISLRAVNPAIKSGDVSTIVPRLPGIFSGGDIILRHEDANISSSREWILKPGDLKKWLTVRRGGDGNPLFSLAGDETKKYLEDVIRPEVDILPQEAKFVITDNKVTEFKASHFGVSLDIDSTYHDLDTAFQERNFSLISATTTVKLSTSIAEPKVTTPEVNDFGIAEIIGTGTSTFKDSHSNRIKNIAHAVEKLNGILIKPGEIFSANKYAGPFSIGNGYLPEQVIKGKEIKVEPGGGMCQIGTTLFRMAMNSGMDITQRRNHSLVVAYYADPVNGNPGTDATLYEPALDLKFLNDTGHYLLLLTNINYKKQMLTFTLWGTPDGRKGWYAHPLVSKWIPAGDEQEVVVADGSLKPGEKKCQGAFRGAVASFVYTRVTPAGEKIERRFDSYYRPLPKICMIGAEKVVETSPVDLLAPIILETP